MSWRDFATHLLRLRYPTPEKFEGEIAGGDLLSQRVFERRPDTSSALGQLALYAVLGWADYHGLDAEVPPPALKQAPTGSAFHLECYLWRKRRPSELHGPRVAYVCPEISWNSVVSARKSKEAFVSLVRRLRYDLDFSLPSIDLQFVRHDLGDLDV